MGDSRRVNRMAALIRSELSRILVQETADPRLQQVVITDVSLSRDLKNARVYVAPPASAAALKDTTRGLVRATPFFRRVLGDRLELRYVPQLEFRADEHTDRAIRVESLLDELKSPPSEE